MSTKRLAGDITEDMVYIMYTDIVVGTLTQRMNDACEVEYVFKFDYDKLDKLDLPLGFPGVKSDLHKDEYVRSFIPAFMHDFLPPVGRGDTQELMRQYGSDEPYDMWKFMKLSHRQVRDCFRVLTPEEYEAGKAHEIWEQTKPIYLK